jgi:hypothetical protein
MPTAFGLCGRPDREKAVWQRMVMGTPAVLHFIVDTDIRT